MSPSYLGGGAAAGYKRERERDRTGGEGQGGEVEVSFGMVGRAVATWGGGWKGLSTSVLKVCDSLQIDSLSSF